MYVTEHAQERLFTRLPWPEAQALVYELERMPGDTGTVAYLMGALSGPRRVLDGSNGDVIVAIAREGSVESVFYRRGSQDLSAKYFGADYVVDRRT
jgi:hypothetical protein